MKIYTSYFAKINKLPSNIEPISIALYPPKWYNGYTCSLLAPTNQILSEWKRNLDEEVYCKNYQKQVLDKLDAKKLIEKFKETIDKDIALICYESPEKFCHRHLVSRWLIENGFECKEFFGGTE